MARSLFPTLLILMKFNKGTEFLQNQIFFNIICNHSINVEPTYSLKLTAQTNFGKS